MDARSHVHSINQPAGGGIIFGEWRINQIADRNGKKCFSLCRPGRIGSYTFTINSMSNGIAVLPEEQCGRDEFDTLKSAAQTLFNYCMKNNIR